MKHAGQRLADIGRMLVTEQYWTPQLFVYGVSFLIVTQFMGHPF
jgi:hypothetical protein